jgi:hypothetical protein
LLPLLTRYIISAAAAKTNSNISVIDITHLLV